MSAGAIDAVHAVTAVAFVLGLASVAVDRRSRERSFSRTETAAFVAIAVVGLGGLATGLLAARPVAAHGWDVVFLALLANLWMVIAHFVRVVPERIRRMRR